MKTADRKMTETFHITGDWQMQSKNLKIKFPSLTDGDLKFEYGRENELLETMASRLYVKREDVIAIIKNGRSSESFE